MKALLVLLLGAVLCLDSGKAEGESAPHPVFNLQKSFGWGLAVRGEMLTRLSYEDI